MASPLQLEQLLVACNEEAGDVPDVITIICGARKFQILERTIQSRGQTLLLSLLEDPNRTDKMAPIYVDGDSERFRYVLDWYRFGSLKIPGHMSIEEMRRECAFYSLPEDVTIEREAVGDVINSLVSSRKKARKECTSAGAVAAAHAAFDQLLHDDGLTQTGMSKKIWSSSKPLDWKNMLVWSAVIDSYWTTEAGLRQSEYDTFKSTLTSLANRSGLTIKISETIGTASYQGKVQQVQVELSSKEHCAQSCSSQANRSSQILGAEDID